MNRLEMMQSFADNLEIERVRMGFSQKKMADELEISLSTYKRIINGEIEKIDLYIAYKLYLLTGKLAYEFIGIKSPDLDLKSKITGLSPSQVEYVNGLVDFEKEFNKNVNKDIGDKKEAKEDYVTVYVPTGNMEDGMIYDSSNVEKLNIAPYRRRFGDKISCGIRITSNHLHPVYNLNDVLLISRSALRDGDTGIFINKECGCAYIRKFYQTSPCKLEPVNDYGKTFYVDSADKADMDRWIKFGKVIAKVR